MSMYSISVVVVADIKPCYIMGVDEDSHLAECIYPKEAFGPC